MLMTARSKFSRRPLRFLLPVVVFLFVAFSLSRSSRQSPSASPFYSKKTKSFFPPLSSPSIGDPNPDFCKGFPTKLLDDIQIVLKTGAGDAAKSKAHLATVTSCITNLIVVSDHTEKIGDHEVIDILAELPSSYAVNSSDFEAYARNKKAQEEGSAVGYSREGWKLDRFKFLPMVDKAHEVNPRAKWYVFLESDVYYFWDTLFRLLDQLDPNDPHYMGSPTAGSDGRWFAYGGAGFVLSQGLMKKLIPDKGKGGSDSIAHRPLSVRYEDWVKADCCGDAVLGYAILNATGTKMESLYPTFSGDELKSLKVDKERWCVPLLSLHRVSPEQMESLWKWERTRPYTQKTFVYSSLLAYTHSHLRDGPTLEFWDNHSEAPQPNDRPCHKSASSCGSECAKDANCLQYSYSQTVCRFAPYIKLGNSVDKENGGQGEFISGWELEKMAKLGFKIEEDIHDTCEEATWLAPQIR
ncbi:uncharacterized protein BDR25DRAFT_253904 [Lindgomyces ingoldianus]|uniref:Uncharacterized protein n=1 Tax=Lindgomyces ingoldianus TaxID=673940 RepID=A0ACB6R7E1_9PLEO|nr:uncharacterized protein BDR25DRAFT_253904 [Lindgomyces ingoldianus]KAF2475091.1 hypothetical protein BDR25DRAFT_253904 [Lindgomyces ingoldianus]